MLKVFIIAIFIIIVTHPLYGYTITVKEKLIGILQKTTIIKNVEYFEIDAGYVHIEIKEKGQVYPYSFPCNEVVQLLKIMGVIFPLIVMNQKVEHQSKRVNLQLERKKNLTWQNYFRKIVPPSNHKFRMR